ncbi:hypothetical protein D3C85_1602710 [compost metagenome]
MLTGLVTPETTDGTAHYSLAHIQKMGTHLQHYVSIEQTTKIWNCGRPTAYYLINLHKLQPSCTLTHLNGDRQLFFNKNEVVRLKNSIQTKKDIKAR